MCAKCESRVFEMSRWRLLIPTKRIRLIITAVLDVATEIIIIAVPAYFLTGLQMARGDKRRAIVLFAFRIG